MKSKVKIAVVVVVDWCCFVAVFVERKPFSRRHYVSASFVLLSFYWIRFVSNAMPMCRSMTEFKIPIEI